MAITSFWADAKGGIVGQMSHFTRETTMGVTKRMDRAARPPLQGN